MNIRARFIGRIQEKKIDFSGVAETYDAPGLTARVMLTKNAPIWVRDGQDILIAWPDGHILRGFENKQKRLTLWKEFMRWLASPVSE